MKILIVDNEATTLTIARAALEQDGHTVSTREQAVGAVDQAIAENPDVIILDVKMPDAGGPQVSQMLRRNPKTRAIPIILYSSLPESDLVSLCKATKAETYITKTGDPDALRRDFAAWAKTK